jgi:hypothetical protein
MKQINIYELQNSINKKENIRISIYQKILERCHQKIKNAASNEQYFVIYDVPHYIVGLPLYNLNNCIEYLISQLKENGFTIEHKLPKFLIISWYPSKTTNSITHSITHTNHQNNDVIPSYQQSANQNSTSIDRNQLYLNYIPYQNDKGKFVLNVD